jgi:hypothetical protein
MKIKINDKVIFKDNIVIICGHDKRVADMRGVVVGFTSNGRVAQVETNGTYMSDDGRSLRSMPINNIKLSQ